MDDKINYKVSKLRKWEYEKETISIKCISRKDYVHSRYVFNGSIYLVNFGENVGDEINNKRPALVVSNRKFNSKSNNVVVLPITKKMVTNGKENFIPKYSSHYFLLNSKYTFLDFNSCVECEQIRVISKSRVLKYLGDLNNDDKERILEKLKKFFS